MHICHDQPRTQHLERWEDILQNRSESLRLPAEVTPVKTQQTQTPSTEQRWFQISDHTFILGISNMLDLS
jgi:hypothetical protein